VGPQPAGAQLLPRVHRASPDPRRAAPFLPTVQPSGLGSPVDCVIVAPDSLADVYQKLADYQTREQSVSRLASPAISYAA